MPHVCPRPCSRLATAALFISVGVVQIVVGIILLRSKYVYLLAGPDFWTSSCNIAVGCLLGLSASIWKQSKKRGSKKLILRRNLLLALLFSDLMINGVTLGIFLLGEGNTLLSIRLENGRKYDHSSFASEVLAYAYVTSVCCPIICIVVTLVSISGSCFKYATSKSPLKMKTPVNYLERDRTRSLRWVYTPELFDKSKKKARELILSSSSESPSDDDSENISMQSNFNSTENIQHVLNRMAQGKRDSILSDSAIMLRQMDIRRKNRYNSLTADGSYLGPLLLCARESAQAERRPKELSAQHDDSTEIQTKQSQRDYSDFNGNIHSLPDVTKKRINYSKNKNLGKLYKNPYTSEELVNEYQNAASKLAKHYPSQYKKFRDRSRAESDTNTHGISETVGIHKKPAKTFEIDVKREDLSMEHKDQKSRESSVRFRDVEDYHKTVQNVASPDDIFSPDGSDFDGDFVSDVSRRSSWAGEVVPINIKHSSATRLSHKLIPVASPVVPNTARPHDAPKTSEDSGTGTIESNSFTEAINNEIKNRKKNMSSFHEDLKDRDIENVQEYPRVGLQSTKKYDLNRVVKMASISEEPNLELTRYEETSEKSYGSQEEPSSKTWRGHSRNKSQSVHVAPSKGASHEEELRTDTTPRRKRSASSKALRRIWSVALSENQTDFMDQVVDADSLIGLTEEELIARQLRTRSIRKIVQQRMKEDVTA